MAALAVLALKLRHLHKVEGAGPPAPGLGVNGDWAMVRASALPGAAWYVKHGGAWVSLLGAVASAYSQQVWVVSGLVPATQYPVSGVTYYPLAKGGHVEFQILAPMDGDYLFTIRYAMDAADAGNVSWKQTHLIVAGGGLGDPDAALGGAFVNTFAPGNHANMTGITANVAGVLQGQVVIVRLERAAGAPDTHPGEFRFIEASYIVTL